MSKTFKKLTIAEWSEVVTKWELGTHTAPQLSSEYGISERAIRAGLRDRGAKRGCRAKEISDAAAESAKSDRQRRGEEATRMREKYLKYNDFMSSMIMRKLGEAHSKGKSLHEIKEDIRTLRLAVAAIGDARDENFHLMGLYNEEIDDTELPDINVGEYTAEELEFIQQNFEDTDTTLEIIDDEEDGPAIPFDEDEGDED